MGGTIEAAGFDFLKLGLGGGIYYNSYKGPGINYGLTFMAGAGAGLTGSLGLNYDSQSGVDIKPGIGISIESGTNELRNIDLSAGINSREGMQYFSLATSLKYSKATTNAETNKTTYDESGLGPGNLTGSMDISFNSPVFGPSISNPTKNYSFSFRLGVGPELFAIFPDGYVSGNFFREYVEDNIKQVRSYGLMFSEEGSQDEQAALDFSREKDIAVREESKSLAIPYATGDVFNIQGHDVGGSYHVSRNDIGVFRDALTTNSGFSASGGFDIGGGAILKAGIDIDVTTSSTTTSGWVEDNLFNNYAPFTNNFGLPAYEPFYFNNAGEVIVKDKTLYNNAGKSKASRVAIEREGSVYVAKNKLINQNIDGGGTTQYVGGILKNQERVKRQQLFSYLNAAEASFQGQNKYIDNYDINSLTCSKEQIIRTVWPSHHLSEITVTKGDGMRYVFGIPAYNLTKKEVTFNVEGNDHALGLVEFSSSDASISNDIGKDHYFDAVSTPPFSHSYLLTEVLSPDYVDNTGNGISPDDRGKAYKINYSKIHSNFKWRTPIEIDSATYNEGLKSVTYDDKGTYVYGEKEIWLTHSIESKNMVAVFILNSEGRDDALGVEDEFGGKDDSKKLRSLNRIELYSKSDLQENEANAIPIKTVHFEYSYDLCKGVPNQVNEEFGKLTLTCIYFTYGKSTKGKLNKYVFDYDASDPNSNPDYNSKNYDRWGTYKNHDGLTDYPLIEDFPYTLQDQTKADTFSAVWNLRQIDLPSGGTINVRYESDDYAYVMDKRAGQMFFIEGFGSNSGSTPTNLLYDGGPNNYMFLTVPVAVSTNAEFQELYLEDIKYLYYKCFVDVNRDFGYEYITGYAEIDSYGLIGAGSTTSVWIKLKNPSFLDEEENPIAYAAWQFLRLNLPEKAYPGSEVDETDPIEYITAIVGVVPSIIDMLVGFNNAAKLNSKGKMVNLDKSFVRLNNPDFKKLGGGSRVNKITLSDNWHDMVPTQESFSYGQEYFYTKEEGGRTISSGVASYEPVVGKDENPFTEPLYYEEKKFLAPDNSYYAELPLGETLFPNATVGYSRVMVRNLQYDDVKRTATGYSISEFYTAREFPTISFFTSLNAEPIKPNPILKILNIEVNESLTASQGFVVELNDMHGKAKFEGAYNEMGALISSKKYDYKVDDPNALSLHLNNACEVVDEDGAISVQTIGMDYDIWEDMRQQKTKVIGGGVHINVDNIFALIVIPIPGIYPSFKSAETLFRSTATTKLIKRTGILSKVTVNENGSEISTENLLYDAETGQTLLTKVTNEYDDPIYKFTYPAHWVYEGMGPSYQNIGAVLRGVSIIDGFIGGIDPTPYVFPGDELLVTNSAGVIEQLHLYVIDPLENLSIVDKSGMPYTNPDDNLTVKIIRSGRRNQSTIPIGNITSLGNPVNESIDSIRISELTEILSADATVFSELWKIEKRQTGAPCDTIESPDTACLAVLLNALFTADLYDIGPEDGWTVDEILGADTTACPELSAEWGDDPFYLISDPIPSYNFLPVPSGPIVTMPAFFNLEYVMGDCRVFVVVDGRMNSVCPTCPLPFTGDYTFANIDGVLTMDYTGQIYNNVPDAAGGFAYTECTDCTPTCIEFVTGDTINPYHLNILGVWRPIKTYAFNANRTPELSEVSTNMRLDGAYEEFDAFYDYDLGSHTWDIDSSDNHWIWVEESKLFDKYGNAIESMNALNIFSSAIYGYNKTVPVAIVSNAHLKQTAVDNFEDYDFDVDCLTGIGNCLVSHFSFEDALSDSVLLTEAEYHTGNFALEILSGAQASIAKTISSPSGNIIEPDTSGLYQLGDDPFIPEFSPIEGDYIMSGWVKIDTICNCKTYEGDLAEITFTGSAETYTFNPAGPIIEGWQRIEGRFSVPDDATAIQVTLNANNENTTYFDDIRIHPYLGNMKSYVYDRISMRLMAQLDENNYATLYEYDEEGNLIRVKRETERGVMTIQEGRSHIKPAN